MEKRTRSERRQASKAQARRIALMIASAAVAAVALGVAVALAVGIGSTRDTVASSDESSPTVDITHEESSTLEAPDPEPSVEVPDVHGKAMDEAEMVLAYAGFVAVRSEIVSAPDGTEPGTVVRQIPEGGTLLDPGAEVVLRYLPASSVEVVDEAPQPHFVVVLDPGHQGSSNLTLEPIGPGSSVMKEKVRGGATGVETRIPEYETVLQIGIETQRILEDAGVEVVMTRSSNDVDISNRKRAEVANQAGADLFVRIHCDGAGDPDVHGASTLYPAGNAWVAPIEANSKSAALRVQAGLVASTGAADRGTVGRDDITGFNWSKVPAVLVECGFLSNPVEDKLLSGEEYQGQVAAGIAAGVLDYLESR